MRTMSVKGEEMEEPAVTFKEQCARCLRGPNLLRTLIVLICIGVVLQQIIACIQKLINIPITTYTHFDFNETMLYPSITFCREPPYKYDKMEEYGLYSHPRFTSTWRNFNFSRVTLDQLWEEITYNDKEFFVQFGLDGLMQNVEVTSHMGFVLGRCHTLSPKILSNKASKASGYSLTLQHNADDVMNSLSTTPPGYHVYVHYTREPFTEVEVYNGGLVDYLYVNTGETIDVKLTVDEYVKISQEEDPCVSWDEYSANECTARYVSTLVGEQTGCSGPWMSSDLPRCANFSSMRNLITAYINLYEDHNCSICHRFCRAFLYNCFVTLRQSGYIWDSVVRQWSWHSGDALLQTNMYIHFNAMMVSVYEESYNYDWNLFLSDLGGSIGFLLGLSVISLISILGKAWSTMLRPFFQRPRIKKDAVSISSASTADVKTISQDLTKDLEYLKKYDWSVKNDDLIS